MNTQKDGGPAFPLPAHKHDPHLPPDGQEGMTIRQYYKAAALQGLLASGMLATKPRQMEISEMCDGIVSSAAEFSDQMLAEDEEHAKK